jgi:hypothetical protein
MRFERTLAMFCLACVSLAGCASDRRAATNRDPWCTGFVEPIPREHEVCRSCVLPIPRQNVSSAVSMLAVRSAIPLSIEQAQHLLGVNALDGDALLEKGAQEADAKAETREIESQMPAFAGDTALRMKEWAAEHRQTAAKARSLKGKVRPYLVRGLVLNEGGRFSVSLNGSTLWILYGCMGRSAVPMRQRPLIVFLEREPETVYVGVSMAE